MDLKISVRNNKGFTLIELIVVIAILGILALIAIPQVLGLVNASRIAADQASISTLNSMTAIYRISNPTPDFFKDETINNQELLDLLIENNYLVSMVEPQSKDAVFAWIVDEEKWYLMFADSFYLIGLNDGLHMQNNRDGLLVGLYSGSAKDIIIPFSLNGETIKEIGQDSFLNSGIVAIAFPNDSEVTAIQRRAFRGNQLTEITLPDSLLLVGNSAFRDNPNLQKIVIGENVTIEDAAFGFDRNDNSFREVYHDHEMSAGTYLYVDGEWIKE